MATLIEINRFPETNQLMAAVNEQFMKGEESVCLVEGSSIIGTMLSRAAAQKAMARRVAEQWMDNPDVIRDLGESLQETPEAWD